MSETAAEKGLVGSTLAVEYAVRVGMAISHLYLATASNPGRDSVRTIVYDDVRW